MYFRSFSSEGILLPSFPPISRQTSWLLFFSTHPPLTHLPFSPFASLMCVGVVTFSCWPTSSRPQDAHRDIQRFRIPTVRWNNPKSRLLSASSFDILHTRRDHDVFIVTAFWPGPFPPNLGKSYVTKILIIRQEHDFPLIFLEFPSGAPHATYKLICNNECVYTCGVVC